VETAAAAVETPAAAAAPTAAPVAAASPITAMDIRIGQIRSVQKHEEADALFVESVIFREESGVAGGGGFFGLQQQLAVPLCGRDGDVLAPSGRAGTSLSCRHQFEPLRACVRACVPTTCNLLAAAPT
jgi:hypothetical protein